MKFTKLALASAAAFGLAGVASATDYVGDGLDQWAPTTPDEAPMTGYSAEGTVSQAGIGAVWFGGSDADDTKVMSWNDEGAPAAYGSMHPSYNGTEMTHGANYLKVSNSNPLWRMLNAYSKTGEDWPTEFPDEQGQAVGDGLFVDTLVQFTPSEDAPYQDGTAVADLGGSKLIVWMNAESNLCVTAAKLILTGDDAGQYVTTNFETDKELKVNTWYRLTVKAYSDLVDDGSGENFRHGFEVYIDGSVVSSAEAAVDTTSEDFEYVGSFAGSDSLEADFNDGKLFMSLDDGATATLAAVGFKGEGLVDDIVVTDVPPTFGPPPSGGIDFTLTWDEGVSAVWYAIGDTTNTVDQVSPATINVAGAVAGETVITYGGIAADAWSSVAPATATLQAENNNYTVTATAASSGGAAGIEGALAGFSAAELQAAFPGASPSDINSDANAYLKYQFGLALSDTMTAAPSVEITDIKPVEGGWTIKVQVKNGENALNLNNGSASTMRATLKVKSAATLADFADASKVTTAAYDITFDGTTTDVITVPTSTNTDPFFKAYVDFATPAN